MNPDRLKGYAQHGVILQGTGDKRRGKCPFCGSASRMPFIAYVDDRAWKCMKCGEGGSFAAFLTRVAARYARAFRGAPVIELEKLRGVPRSALRRFGIGWHAASRCWTIPVRAGGSDPEVAEVINVSFWRPDGKKSLATSGGKPGVIFAPDDPPWACDTIWVCEGEWDAMVLDHVMRSVGPEGTDVGVVGVPGAGVFPRTLAQGLIDKHVVLAYDNDKSGRDGRDKAHTILEPQCRSVRAIAWPPGTVNGYDIRDVWLESGKRARSTHRTLCGYLTTSAGVTAATPNTPARAAVIPTTLAGKGLSRRALIAGFRKWLHLPDPTILDVVFGTVYANRLGDDPVWMFIVGPPGCGKTAPLEPLFDGPLVAVADTMTPASLVSGSNAAGNRDPSEIPRWKDRVVVMKDFTTVLALPEAQRNQVFGYLRGASDGRIDRTFGNGVRRCFLNTRFGIIAGVTPEIERYMPMSSALGPRFLRYRVRSALAVGAGSAIIDKALETVDQDEEAQKREELRQVAHAALDLKIAARPRIGHDLKKLYRVLGQWTATMRGAVARDKYTQRLDYLPQAEIGTRLTIQLAKLSMGVAVLRRHATVGLDEFRVAVRVARDCVPDKTEAVVREVWVRHDDVDAAPSADIARWCRLPPEVIQHVLEDGYLLRIFRRVKPKGSAVYHWGLSHSLVKLMEQVDPFAAERQLKGR